MIKYEKIENLITISIFFVRFKNINLFEIDLKFHL